MDQRNQGNRGFLFINFKRPEKAEAFYQSFHGQYTAVSPVHPARGLRNARFRSTVSIVMASFEAVLEHVWGSAATREGAKVGGLRPPTFPGTCSVHLRTFSLFLHFFVFVGVVSGPI